MMKYGLAGICFIFILVTRVGLPSFCSSGKHRVHDSAILAQELFCIEKDFKNMNFQSVSVRCWKMEFQYFHEKESEMAKNSFINE